MTMNSDPRDTGRRNNPHRSGTFVTKSCTYTEVTSVLARSTPPLLLIMADPLAQAAALAGIDLANDPIARYLAAIGIKSHATIATYLPDDSAVDAVLNKVKTGVKVGAIEFKLDDNADGSAMKAQWMVLIRTANQSYLASITASTPTSPTSATTTATGSGTDKDSVPKTLPASVYTTLVEDYNKITIDGDRRQFPEKQLVGAEKVLARMYHEHHTSKMYTTTSLEEIMSQRVWTSFNTINTNRKPGTTGKRLILDDKNNIAEKSPEDWDVRGLWMLHGHRSDSMGLDSTQLRLRELDQRVPNVKALWEDVSWDIAMRMRNKETFATITEGLMADFAKTNEILQQPLTKKPRTGKEYGQQNPRYKGYQPKWSPPGKGRRYRTANNSPWQSWSSSSSPSTWQTWATSPTWPSNWPPVGSSWGNHSDYTDTYLSSEPDPDFHSDAPLAAQVPGQGQQREREERQGRQGGKK